MTGDRARVASSVLAIAVYAVLLAGLKWVPRYDCVTLVPLLVVVFRVLAPVAPRARSLAVHAIAQILCFAFLDHLWTLGYEGRNAVFGGILPWSDSFDYYDDALRLVHGGRFSEVSSKRPLFTTVFAALLKMSGGDLRFALAVCAIAGAAAVAIATLELWRTHGARAAFVVFFVLLCFERRWTGFIQTEHVGLPLGALGFALFWRANRVVDEDRFRARRLALIGLFAIATGLMARAGAFFVIPALAIWGARKIAPDRKLGFLVNAALAAAAGFAVHKAVLAATGSGVTFSDYPGIVYGLVHGEDYSYLNQTHPVLSTLAVTDRVAASWTIVLADMRAHPGMVVLGLLKSGGGLFASPFGMWSYVWTNPDDHVLENADAVRASMQAHGLAGPLLLWKNTLGLYSLVNAGVMALLSGAFVIATAAAIVKLFVKRRSQPELSLLRHVAVGVIASAPFTPPWITSGMQVQTVTLAFVAAFSGCALLARPRDDEPPVRDAIAFAPPAFAAVVAILVAWLKLAPNAAPSCSGHRVEIYPSTAVEVAPARSALFRSKAEADLRFSIEFLARHNEELTDSIVPYMHPGTVYVAGFDACERKAKLLVDDTRALGDARWQTIDATPLEVPRILRVTKRNQTPVEP
ncbi:MAG TPA: hypothetical protein VIF62_35740 [Labilithrix sp.]|jgi:hypothetical protein